MRETKRDGWPSKHGDCEWWVEVNDVEVRDAEEPPSVGDYYSEWYLLDEDFPDGTEREDVDEELVQEVLEGRREYPVPNDLSLHSTEHLKASRRKLYRDVEDV